MPKMRKRSIRLKWAVRDGAIRANFHARFFCGEVDRLAQRWMWHMRRGNFEAAWQISDAVLAQRAGKNCNHLPRHKRGLWSGTPLEDKRVLIRCLHGLGDTIQFVRYVRLLRRITTRVAVSAQTELIPLLNRMRFGPDALFALDEPTCDYDLDIDVMELPHIFRTTLATIPADVPYFDVKPARLPDAPKPNVRLVWQAGDWDRRRSIPFTVVLQLGGLSDRISWHILQRGTGMKEWHGKFGLNTGSDDILEAARIIAGLDLLICIDSMPAHLAGALRVPTWLLLHNRADWRWMIGRDDSPWYPTIRLFRQPRPGDWQSVLAAVAHLLSHRTAQYDNRSAVCGGPPPLEALASKPRR